MKILIFFSRIVLICNICFILAELLRYSGGLQLNPVYSTLIVLGYVSLLLNVLFAISVFVMLALKKPVWNSFPRWLLITNFLFLTAQLFIFLG